MLGATFAEERSLRLRLVLLLWEFCISNCMAWVTSPQLCSVISMKERGRVGASYQECARRWRENKCKVKEGNDVKEQEIAWGKALGCFLFFSLLCVCVYMRCLCSYRGRNPQCFWQRFLTHALSKRESQRGYTADPSGQGPDQHSRVAVIIAACVIASLKPLLTQYIPGFLFSHSARSPH